MREAISKRIRFNVFKRDFFKCQYCGSTPPAAVLEVDHINPVANGGGNSTDNLITACFDCNRGKGAVLLSALPDSVSEKALVLAEKLAQLKAFEKLIRSNKKQEESRILEVEQAFQIYHPKQQFSAAFRESVRTFLKKLPAHVVVDAMVRACSKINRCGDAIKYFCGICWKTIRDGEHVKG